jgi:DNA helicase-2/ATP-dependent DNA helicase PcrA
VRDVSGVGIAEASSKREVDFTDQIWLPNVLSLPAPRLDWVFVDEAQDLNAAQRELVLRCRAPGGRMLFVGDERQAIMAFAGADANSYRTIQRRTGATELPLSICYRCPESHLRLAREIVPQIEAAPGAIEGTIERLADGKFPQNLQGALDDGDEILVACRTTAPLVRWCIKLIRQRIPAKVRGRDVAAGLTQLVRKLGSNGDWAVFPERLQLYYQERSSFLSKKPNSEDKLAILDDTVAAVEACYEEFGAVDAEDLCRQIEGIFADYATGVWLSTVHRAKGLEADRVYILHEEKLPLRWAGQTRVQETQEWNLRYVALTRSKSTLTFIE